jgi:hypothetical protein
VLIILKHIDRLPELQEELNRLIKLAQEEISRLPSPPSSEPVSEILKLIGAFTRSIQRLVDGVPEKTGLLQTLRGPRDKFKETIRHTAPYFLPLEKNVGLVKSLSLPLVPPFSFLSSEEKWEQELCNSSSPIFINDVLETANK